MTSDGLVDAVRRAATGEPVVAPAVLARMMAGFAARPPATVPPPGFEGSATAARVLALIGAGRSNTEIAAELVINMATVKTHVRHVFAKLGLRDRARGGRISRPGRQARLARCAGSAMRRWRVSSGGRRKSEPGRQKLRRPGSDSVGQPTKPPARNWSAPFNC